MFRRLRNWWSDRRIKNQRGLFRYHDGERWRYADPFATWRSIINHSRFSIETMALEVDRGGEPETTICIEAMCEVFGVERWDKATNRGLTDWQILSLLDQFDRYLTSVKKNSSTGPTSSAPTDSDSSPVQVPPEPTTNSSSDFTSTQTERTFGGGTSESAL